METTEVQELLSKVGVSSDSDKQSFRNMYNYVFDPIVKIPSFQPEGDPNITIQAETTTTEPEIQAFLGVFRKLFRSSVFPNLALPITKAGAAFRNAVGRHSASRSSQMTPDELKTLQTKLLTRVQTLEKWIKEVDAYRRNQCQKAVREDAVANFKLELSVKYPFDSFKFYKEADILRFSKELETKIVGVFYGEMSHKFRNATELEGWCADLLQELSQHVAGVIQQNKQNLEHWNQKTMAPAARFKEMMATFFKNHQFATKEAVDSFRDKAKSKCGLLEFRYDPVLNSAWESRVEEELRGLETKWRAEGDGVIDAVLKPVKTTLQRAFKKRFNLELEGGELERMFSQVAKIAKLNLEKATETTSDNDNMANINKTSLASIGIPLKTGYKIIIPANTKLPTGVFRNGVATTIDNQISCAAAIYEGDNPQAAGYRQLGVIRWTNIPAAAKEGVVKLDYTMQIDASGLLHVEWEVCGSGRKESAEFKTSAWQGNNESDEGSQVGHSSTCSKRTTRSSDLAQGGGSKKAKM